MSRSIYAACNCRKEIHTFEKAQHGLSYIQDTPRYEKTVRAFMNGCLAEYKG